MWLWYILLIVFLNEPELICLHTVKLFQVLLTVIVLFAYSKNVPNITNVIQIAQFNINVLFGDSKMESSLENDYIFLLTHRQDPNRYYHSG